MINEKPTPEVFFNKSVNCYLEALTLLSEFTYDDGPDQIFFEKDDFSLDLFTSNNRIRIDTISLLIFTSIENYLKYLISLESILLLITDLSKLKNSFNFSQYHMHGFPDLIKIYSAIYGADSISNIQNLFDKLRESRNELVHGAHSNKLALKEVLSIGSDFIINIWNKNVPKNHDYIFKYFSEKIGALEDYSYPDFITFPQYGDYTHNGGKLITLNKINSIFLSRQQYLNFLGLSKTDKLKACPVCNEYNRYPDDTKHIYSAIEIKKNNQILLKCYVCHAKILKFPEKYIFHINDTEYVFKDYFQKFPLWSFECQERF